MTRGLRDRFGRGQGNRGRAATRGELLTKLARVALWIAVAVVLIRGVGDVLGGGHTEAMPHAARAARAGAWPDDAARALAVQFATAYLTHVPSGDPETYSRGLAAMASPDVAAELAPRFPLGAVRQTVRSAAVAGSVGLDGRRALITVAATVQVGRAVSTTRITVPVARDSAGGLVVHDLPSVAPAAARARSGPVEIEPLLGNDRGPIEDEVGRFVRAYLAGDQGVLSYLMVPGARIAAASARLRLLSVADLQSAGPARRGERLVAVTVHARDPVTRVAYWLRYRVAVVKRDRWYVAALNSAGRGQSR